jgi:hypothetical protein
LTTQKGVSDLGDIWLGVAERHLESVDPLAASMGHQDRKNPPGIQHGWENQL